MVIAIRWVGVWNRLVRPTSRGWAVPPRTTGTIPASQAIILAWAAVTGCPVSNIAGWSVTPVKSWIVIITTTWAVTPPAWGVRSVG